MEDNKIKLEIVTPQRLLLSEKVDEVIIPGVEGEFGVMPQHTPFLTSLRIGQVTVFKQAERDYLVVGKGLVEVTPLKVTILTQRAVAAKEIDLSKTKEEEQQLETKLKDLPRDDPDFESVKEDLNWTQYKAKVAALK